MKEEELDDFDEEEFEMLINGLIHPGDMFTPPDMLAGAHPVPFGGPSTGMPGMEPPAPFGGGIDSMIAQAYDEEE